MAAVASLMLLSRTMEEAGNPAIPLQDLVTITIVALAGTMAVALAVLALIKRRV